MRTRAGMTLALAAAVISGFAVYLNSYGVHAWNNAGGATAYTTAKTLVAAIVLVAAGAALVLVATGRKSSTGPALAGVR